jgi:A/G-specific adenine glycosylase
MIFSRELLAWYKKNKRDLPWRRTKDPYHIWLSEIILQQTRIEQGTPYYERFVGHDPGVRQLAEAGEQEVLKLWQGLGYYSRARNLHATAQSIVTEHNGSFPATYSDIRGLKGIGDYTAAAIASICFDLPYPVMDGNVLRFISRLHGITGSIDLPATKRMIMVIATENIDRKNPGDFNQAMMEFGAMVCTPANPHCDHCVFKTTCVAYRNNMVSEIPARKAKATIRHRYLHYLVLTVDSQAEAFICLNKRTGDDIWKNLYDFPCIERTPVRKENHLPPGEFGSLLGSSAAEFREVSGQYIHLLTHQKLHARFYWFHSGKLIDLPFMPIPLKDIFKYPIPKLIERYLSENFSQIFAD